MIDLTRKSAIAILLKEHGEQAFKQALQTPQPQFQGRTLAQMLQDYADELLSHLTGKPAKRPFDEVDELLAEIHAVKNQGRANYEN